MFTRMRLAMAIALARVLGTTPVSMHRAALDHNRTVDAIRDAAGRDVLRDISRRPMSSRLFASAARLIPRRRAKGNGYLGPNGAQAMARRVRQFVTGHSTACILYVQPDGSRWSPDSNGVQRQFYA